MKGDSKYGSGPAALAPSSVKLGPQKSPLVQCDAKPVHGFHPSDEACSWCPPPKPVVRVELDFRSGLGKAYYEYLVKVTGNSPLVVSWDALSPEHKLWFANEAYSLYCDSFHTRTNPDWLPEKYHLNTSRAFP